MYVNKSFRRIFCEGFFYSHLKRVNKKTEELEMMNLILFGQIVLLMVIYAFIREVVKCLHDTYCKKCK